MEQDDRLVGDMQEVIKNLLTVAEGSYKEYTANRNDRLKKMIESQGYKYSPGIGYYQLTKLETVQSYKGIILQEKGTKKMWEGEAVRRILGLKIG
jgi:hypothetical protein